MRRHDRTGERLEDEDQAAEQPHRCDRGWLDRDADRPVPCLVCKPHLARPPRAPAAEHGHARTGIGSPPAWPDVE